MVAFYNDREQVSAKGDEGSRDLELIGVVVQNRNADQFEFQLGYQDFRFQDYEHDDFPRYVYYNNRIARLEYTRTTSARGRELKPSFGLRYGGAVFLRSGVSTSRYHYPQGTSGFRQYLAGQGSVLSLQPTVWCGYRSARVLFGVQLHWNVLAHVWGSLEREEYWREGLEPHYVDSTAHFSSWLTVDSFLENGLLLNDISLKLTLNLVGVGKRQAVPEPRPRKAARKCGSST